MSSTGNTASHFTVDLPKLQGEVESDPSKAKNTIKHVFGITPGTAGEPIQASLQALKELFESCYENNSTLFPVGITNKCAGCITVVQSPTGTDYSLKYVVAPAAVYPQGATSAPKAHSLVGFSGVDCYTRGGKTVDLSDLSSDAFFTKLSYTHAINRLRSCRVPWSRSAIHKVKTNYKTIFAKSQDILKAKKSNDDDFLVMDSNENTATKARAVLAAALPVYFPVSATADFAFMSEVALPSSLITGTESDQEKEWKTFKETLISFGCRKESVLLDDSFFRLWVRAVVTSPSIFAAEGTSCNYHDIDSKEAQQAALQTMLKVKLDSLWCHDKDKQTEAYLLLLYAHSIARPFTMDDWVDEMELETDDGTVYKLEKDWWASQFEDLPQALELGEHHSNDVHSPDFYALLKRKRELQSSSANKQPRSILNNITPIVGPVQLMAHQAKYGTMDPSQLTGDSQSAQPSHNPKVHKSTFSAITDRNLENLFAYSLRAGDNYEEYLDRHNLRGPWTILDRNSEMTYVELDKLSLLPGPIKSDIKARGPGGMSHHKSILDCITGSRLHLATLSKEDLFSSDAFGLFLKGEWEKDIFGPKPFTGFTPLMCLLMLPYCEKNVVNGVAQPLMPALGFEAFDDILVFLEAIIALFSHFVETSMHNHKQPLLLYEYDTLLNKLAKSPWARVWNTLNIDKPYVSLSIMKIVHNIFARSAFHADQTGESFQVLKTEDRKGARGWVPSVCNFGTATIDRYDLSDTFRGETEELFKSVTEFLNTTMFTETKPMTVVSHFIFKPTQAQSAPSPKNNEGHQFVALEKPTIAPPTKVILKPKTSIKVLRDEFGPGPNFPRYPNPKAPRGGENRRGKNQRVLCIDFLVGLNCARDKCAFHLQLEKTSIEGHKGNNTEKSYAQFRQWCKKNSNFVEPTAEALKNNILFPEGKL